LQLWEHLSIFPGPNAPLASFGSVARALERLDPENLRWGYFDAYNAGVEPESKPNVRAAELALALDRSLGGLIRLLLREATLEAVSAEKKWLGPKQTTIRLLFLPLLRRWATAPWRARRLLTQCIPSKTFEPYSTKSQTTLVTALPGEFHPAH
jgi:hypothetical protein